MNSARNGHTATLLGDGRVLVVGGHNGSPYLSSAELFFPGGPWNLASPMPVPAAYHTATLLSDDTVLVTGGINATGSSPLANTSVYDHVHNVWTLRGLLSTGRWEHTATLLNNGQVLVAGGKGVSNVLLDSTELYTP